MRGEQGSEAERAGRALGHAPIRAANPKHRETVRPRGRKTKRGSTAHREQGSEPKSSRDQATLLIESKCKLYDRWVAGTAHVKVVRIMCI